MNGSYLPIDMRRMLLADWFRRIAQDAGLVFTQRGPGREEFSFGPPNGFNVKARYIDAPPFLAFVASDPEKQTVVDDVATRAAERTERGDFGGVVWYSTTLPAPAFQFNWSSLMGALLQRLGSQTRIVGWRRLGGSAVLLEFTEAVSEDGPSRDQLFLPEAHVHVHFRVSAPCEGFLASYVVHKLIEPLAAICTFALGRAVRLPPAVFPSKPEVVSDLNARSADVSILTLARKGVSLDIFSPNTIPGGVEFYNRARAALQTFDAALRQESDLVACILYVAAAESLTVPNAPWRRSRLVARFIDFFECLMPDALDRIVGHGNFEEVFDIRRGNRQARALRRELLDRLYDFRSGQLHRGLGSSYAPLGIEFSGGITVRRSLFADFAESAILGCLSSPRSSLVGHPKLDSATADPGEGAMA